MRLIPILTVCLSFMLGCSSSRNNAAKFQPPSVDDHDFQRRLECGKLLVGLPYSSSDHRTLKQQLQEAAADDALGGISKDEPTQAAPPLVFYSSNLDTCIYVYEATSGGNVIGTQKPFRFRMVSFEDLLTGEQLETLDIDLMTQSPQEADHIEDGLLAKYGFSSKRVKQISHR
jgi:hypothetical protein